jgi:hypothetical protein
VRLSTDCALQAVACNPHAPSLVAAGGANGGVYAWDLSADAAHVYLGRSETGLLDVGHQQAVHSVVWAYSSDEAQHFSEPNRAFLICSVGMCAPQTTFCYRSTGKPSAKSPKDGTGKDSFPGLFSSFPRLTGKWSVKPGVRGTGDCRRFVFSTVGVSVFSPVFAS